MIIDKSTKTFADEIIRNRTFVGKVITNKTDDRNIVIVDEHNDLFISKMKMVDNLLAPIVKQISLNNYWLEYNQFGQPMIYCKLETNLKHGWYWFMVKGIVFDTNCIFLNLSTIHRLTVPRDNYMFFNWEKLAEGTSRVFWNVKNNPFINDVFNRNNIRNILTDLSNFMRFSLLLFLFCFTSLIDILKILIIYLPNYMTGFANIVAACSPVFKEIIISFMKIVGAFTLFMCMIWKDLSGNNKPRRNSYHYSQIRNNPEIKYYK